MKPGVAQNGNCVPRPRELASPYVPLCAAGSRWLDGDIPSRVCRGRPLSKCGALSRSAWVRWLMSVPLGKYWCSSPLVFSFDLCCHGLLGSQKQTPPVPPKTGAVAIVSGRGDAPDPTIQQTPGSKPLTVPDHDQSTGSHHPPATDPKPQPALLR